MSSKQRGVVSTWGAYLALDKNVKAIGIGEGNTPLIPVVNLAKKEGLDLQLYLKYEGLNPTGSFKDRGMAVAVTAAYAKGAKTLLCASTGNTSASAAAYAARSGLNCAVVIPEGKIAMGKLAQAIIYGAKIFQIKGNFDDGMRLVKEIAENSDEIELVNSVNPMRIEGQKTAAFEIVDEIGVPDYHVLPVGNAGNITAYWKGYSEYFEKKKCNSTPIMVGYQASGAAPFMRGEPVLEPETIATAIRIGNPQSWQQAQAAKQESGGWFNEVSDDEILHAMQLLASLEGVFCEPASACTVAGILKDYKKGRYKKDAVVACTLTGNGLKDPNSVSLTGVPSTIATVSADKDSILKELTQ